MSDLKNVDQIEMLKVKVETPDIVDGYRLITSAPKKETDEHLRDYLHHEINIKSEDELDYANKHDNSGQSTSVELHHCDVCNKRFHTKADLQVHYCTHIKKKPFKCDALKKDFTRSSTLKLHMRSHHNHDKPFKCNDCERQFSRRSYYNQHLRKCNNTKSLKRIIRKKMFSRQPTKVGYSRRAARRDRASQLHRTHAYCTENDKLQRSNLARGQKRPVCAAKQTKVTELLIGKVRERVYLYDPSNVSYKDVMKKAAAWNDIASQLKITSDVAKAKWKNLRDSYIKYKKALKGATGQAMKYQKWPWSSHFKFLDYTLESHPRRRRVKTRENVIEEVQSKKLTPPKRVKENNSELSEYYVSDVSAKARKMLTPSKVIRQMVKRHRTDEHFDEIDYLFLSFAQTFKKLSQRDQALLKMDIAKLFGQIEIAELDASKYE